MTTRGLVIGAGGVTGLAWSSATLIALEQQTGWDPREADALLGTSQGALLVSLLAYGIGTADLHAWYRRELPDGHPLRSKAPRADAVRWSLPVPAAPGLALRGLLGRTPPAVALSGLLPAGQASLDAFLAPLITLAGTDAHPPHPSTWVVAVDYDSGDRMCFGSPGAPDPGIVPAVRASCSVPGFYPPVRIGDRRYVDGGVFSTTSADLLAPLALDEVVVLAPMAGPRRRPRSLGHAADFTSRTLANRRLTAETDLLTVSGVRVRVLTPSREDLRAMGGNPLDPKRRIATFETALRTAPDQVAAAFD